MLTFLLPSATDKEQLVMKRGAGREMNRAFKAQFALISRLNRENSIE
jgi:hypothetical protein